MKTKAQKITAKVWLYPGEAAWHFITIDPEISAEIQNSYLWPRRGFGAIPVSISLGNSKWKTSVFPEKKGTYLLPLKKEIRKKEKIGEGDIITFTLEVLN